MLTAFQPPRGHKNAIWGYNRISLQPPRMGLRGRSRTPEPPCFRRFRRFRKPGQKRQPSFAAIRAGQYGHFSAASRLPFSAGDRHRPRVPSLIAVPVSSPFREDGLPENVPRRFGSLDSPAPCRVFHAACPLFPFRTVGSYLRLICHKQFSMFKIIFQITCKHLCYFTYSIITI